MSERLRQLFRFGIVGGVNTVVDIAIFLALHELAQFPIVLSNVVSTGTALALSFALNRRYTFRSGGRAARQAARFVAVTLVGLWILQPLVIWATLLAFGDAYSGWWASLIAKLTATVASLVWNYLWYSKFVFRPAAADDSDAVDPGHEGTPDARENRSAAG